MSETQSHSPISSRASPIDELAEMDRLPVASEAIEVGAQLPLAPHLPDLRNAYRIELDPPSPDLTDTLQICGLITNNGPTPWGILHRIGLRHFENQAGETLAGVEFRGKIEPAVVMPGENARFSFDIDVALLPIEAVRCQIDMVLEGSYWFSDGGAIAQQAAVRGFRQPGARLALSRALARLAPRASPAEQDKLDVLRTVLSQFDFSAYESVIQLCRLVALVESGRSYRPPVAGSEAVSASLGHEKAPHARRSAFFKGFLSTQDRAASAEDTDPILLVEAMKEFVHEGYRLHRNSTAPFPLSLARWLNGRLLPPELAHNPVSRSMAILLGDRHEFNLAGAYDDLIWSFATNCMVDLKMPAGLVPDSVLRQLATSPAIENFEQLFPNATGFMSRLQRDDANYRSRYNLSLDAGRCAFAFDLLLLGLENEARRLFVGRDILDWMTKPIGPSIRLTPFEILLAGNSGNLAGVNPIAQAEDLAAHSGTLRKLFQWLPSSPRAETYPIRVLGHYSSSTGLGTNMRMSLQTLNSLDFTTDIIDAQSERLIPGKPRDRELGRPVDLFHLNLDEVPGLIARYADCSRVDTYRIGFALWEASVMPEQHRAGATLVDELWVPTTYLADVYRHAGFNNIHVIGKAIDVSGATPMDRSEYGLDDDHFVFATSFDLDSWVERKNPSAAVEAFQLAFPNDPRARLIVKTTGIFDHPGDRTRQVARVLAAADRDPRIVLINERLPFASYLGLIQMADAVISPHRAEGFGYFPAYAMLLGRPVLATDHSGTTDFCTTDTSYPVKANMTSIARGDFVYDVPGAMWADVDVADLAEKMRRVREDRSGRERKVTAGRALVEQRYSYDAMAGRYLARLEQIGQSRP